MARKHTLLLRLNYGCEIMGFSFSFAKKPKTGKLIGKYVDQRNQHKKSYQEQLDRLDLQLQHENIDKIERDRLRTILEAKYYQQQQEDWDQLQKLMK